MVLGADVAAKRAHVGIVFSFPSQEHQNEDLYEKAVSILETYFECEEGDDQNLAPQMAGNQYAFGQQVAPQVCQHRPVNRQVMAEACSLLWHAMPICKRWQQDGWRMAEGLQDIVAGTQQT